MEFQNNYNWIDRMLHRLAFATPRLQIDFATSEDRKFADLPLPPPLFITGLPRAGTTLLLDRFAGLDEFATHSYRDMPFVLVPQLWSKISQGFQLPEQKIERAHGDGMLVGTDSPEAFEEMLWMAFFPKRYVGDRIKPWAAEHPLTEFKPFFANHMRKIAALRRPGYSARYVSKNNLNIARIGALGRAFPEADIVVPFRGPVQHAASLHRQHLNFLALHQHDDFAKRYMAGVGHFDFGANLKPINFGGWFDEGPHRDPLHLNFWLAYWYAAYQHIVQNDAERVILIEHDALCAAPVPLLKALATRLRLADSASFVAGAAEIKPIRARDIDLTGVDTALLDQTSVLFEVLKTQTLIA